MPNTDPHMQIARKLRTVETLKIELVQQLAEVLRGVHSGNERDMSTSIGILIGMLYYLARQMGVPLESIDKELRNNLPKVIGQDPSDMADYEFIQRFLAAKR